MQNRKRLTDILNGNGDSFRHNWDSTQAAEDFAPLPPGEYTARVLSGELFTSKRNNTPGYKLTLEVSEGYHEGRRVWLDYWLTPAALPMAKRDLAKIGIVKPEQLEDPIPAGLLLKVKVVLRRDDDGNELNKVTRFEFVGTESGDAFAPKDDDDLDTSFDPAKLDGKPKGAGPTNGAGELPLPLSSDGPYGREGERR
jgi:hypothetical protein